MSYGNFTILSSDLFLLERWQEDSPLSTDVQRELLFAEYISFGVRGRQRYRDELRQRSIQRGSDAVLTPEEGDLFSRIHQPTAERLSSNKVWLRTCYEPSSDNAFWAASTSQKACHSDLSILSDASLYDFGADWQKIFLRMPQLLESLRPANEYEELVRAEFEEGNAANAVDPTVPFAHHYADYHMALTIGCIHIFDAEAFASEDYTLRALVVWYDECGRIVRFSRETIHGLMELAPDPGPDLSDHDSWTFAKIGEFYRWGAPLGPPYITSDGNSGDNN